MKLIHAGNCENDFTEWSLPGEVGEPSGVGHAFKPDEKGIEQGPGRTREAPSSRSDADRLCVESKQRATDWARYYKDLENVTRQIVRFVPWLSCRVAQGMDSPKPVRTRGEIAVCGAHNAV